MPRLLPHDARELRLFEPKTKDTLEYLQYILNIWIARTYLMKTLRESATNGL